MYIWFISDKPLCPRCDSLKYCLSTMRDISTLTEDTPMPIQPPNIKECNGFNRCYTKVIVKDD